LVTGLRVLNGIGATRTASARHRQVSRSALHATLQASSSQGLYLGAMHLGTGVFTLIVAMTAGYLALIGQLTVGAVVKAVADEVRQVVPVTLMRAQFLPRRGSPGAYPVLHRAHRARCGRIAERLVDIGDHLLGLCLQSKRLADQQSAVRPPARCAGAADRRPSPSTGSAAARRA